MVSEISVFTFHAEIQDGRQKWREVIFEKSRQYTLDTLGVENFDKIPLSHTVKEIEASGVNGKPVYRISFRLGRNDEIRKEYLSTGY